MQYQEYQRKMQKESETCGANKIGYTDSDRKTKTSTISVNVEIEARSGFPIALEYVLNGGKITRHGWNAKSQWVCAQRPDLNSKMQCPYLYLKNAQDLLIPWIPSQGDLFANDWAMLPDSN